MSALHVYISSKRNASVARAHCKPGKLPEQSLLDPCLNSTMRTSAVSIATVTSPFRTATHTHRALPRLCQKVSLTARHTGLSDQYL
jgi:hypothetical protein